jgi:hypothetical protein
MSTSTVELSNVSAHGLWLLVDERELYLPFDDFPWFREATIGQLSQIERPKPDHLRWPDLDVDLSLDSIEHPERFPLVSGVGSHVRDRERRETGPGETEERQSPK